LTDQNKADWIQNNYNLHCTSCLALLWILQSDCNFHPVMHSSRSVTLYI
jgi:hypothetical protein